MIVARVADVVIDDVFLQMSDYILGSTLYLKLEGLNPAGSIKLKTAVGLLDAAERQGLLTPGSEVIESSSGNLGIALSMTCRERGYHFTCVTDPNTSDASVAMMRAAGADVVCVTRRDSNGGYLESRITHILERMAENPALVWTNQYANPANAAAHQDRTSASILAELGRVDYLFIGAGTTGTLMGCIAEFNRSSPHTKVIAVDTVGSVTFGQPAGRRHLPGLGTSRRPELFRPAEVDRVIFVEEADAVRMCRNMALNRGLVAGASTGSVLSAIRDIEHEIPPGSIVVALSPDLGDRYLQTIYNDEWVTARFGADVVSHATKESTMTTKVLM